MLEKDRPGKLFIGGLSLDISEARLETVFGKYGRITEVLLIRDKVHKQSRGFGFVTYENPQDALDACKGLNDTELNGSNLHVTEAVVRSDPGMSGSPRRGGFSGRGRGGPPSGSRYSSSRGRGGPPMRKKSRRSRDDSSYDRRDSYDRGGRDRSPLRKSPMLSSRGAASSRDGYGSRSDGPPPRRPSDFSSRGPPPSDRRDDRYSSQASYSDTRSSYPPARREYRSPPRESRSSALLDDRLPPRNSYARDPPVSSRAPAYSSRDYPPRDYSPPPPRDRTYPERADYGYLRDDRKDSYARPSGGRDYPPRAEYSTRDYSREYSSREAPPPRDTYPSRESYSSARREFSDSRDYGGSKSTGGYSSRDDIGGPPPSKDSYKDSGGPRSYVSGSKSSFTSSRGPPPSSRGPPQSSRGPPQSSERRGEDRNGFSGASRHEAPPSRAPPPKRSRVEDRPPSRGRPPLRR